MQILEELLYGPDVEFVKTINLFAGIDAEHFVHPYAFAIPEIAHGALPFSLPTL